MQFKTSFVSFVVLALSTATARGIEVRFYPARACTGNVYYVTQNVPCNSCVNPPVDSLAVQITGISATQRVSVHSQTGCASSTSLAEFRGPACVTSGATALRSSYVACPGFRAHGNGTEGGPSVNDPDVSPPTDTETNGTSIPTIAIHDA